MKRLILLVLGALFSCAALNAQDGKGPQLYNMGFDHWSKKGGEWRLWANDDPASRQIWGTANKGLSLLGVNGTMPESDFVAVKGPGKNAVKMRSINVLWAFAAGSLFTGSFLRLEGTSGAAITNGAPFNGRPAALEGYYCYQPAKINYAREPHLDKKGKRDIGHIEILLTDWEEPFEISISKKTFIDLKNDPHIIAYSDLKLTSYDSSYVHFSIPIHYRNGRTPKYAVIVATPSIYGGYFTGGNGSVLYLDEFSFVY